LDFEVTTVVASGRRAAFATIAGELELALHKAGIEFEGRAGGRLVSGDTAVGRVVHWRPQERFGIVFPYPEWRQGDTRIEVMLRPSGDGTRVTLKFSGLESQFLAGDGDQLGWFADRVLAHLVNSSSPSGLGDWLTDRVARMPTGATAREGYRNPTHHRPNFGAILEALELRPGDRFLEVGCGGGALLKEALRRGCTAVGVDHSLEMVRLSARANAKAVRERRLEVREARADSLPLGDSTFTCAAMTGVLGFLEDPVRALAEVHRVLAPGGRLAVFSTSKEARGTIAAPEPMASHLRFYEDSEIEGMALAAGFREAEVKRPDLSRFAKGTDIPAADRRSFTVPFGQLLYARR
jgi:SAM-dependent methyltransferase